MKLKDITTGKISKEIEDALNKAINKLDVEEDLVFESIKVSQKKTVTVHCRRVRKCKVQSNGSLVCKWVEECD